MKTYPNQYNKKHKGVALIWMAIFFIAMLGLMAIMLDYGRAYVAVHQVQNAADAAALAGARYVPMTNEPNYTGSSAEQIAHNYGLDYICMGDNVYLDTTVTLTTNAETPIDAFDPAITDDIIIGRYIDHSGEFFVDHDTPDAMMVIARRGGTALTQDQPPLSLMFASLYPAVDATQFKRYAVAKIDNPYGAGLLALGECCNCPGIIFSGGGSVDDLTVFGGGSLYVNSCNENAVSVDGNISVDVERIYSVGGIDDKFYNQKNDITDTDINQGTDPEPDPYASLPDNYDDYAGFPDKGIITDANDPMTYSPGYYSGGIQITSSQVTLEPGDYYLDSVDQNASMAVNGGLITGEGVTLHIVGDADYGINIGGNADIDISAPTSGPYAGIAIYEKRDPDYDCDQSCADPWSVSFPMSELNGSGDIIIDGAVYMPNNKFELNGTGLIELARVVADRFYISGNGEKIVNYKGVPKIASKSYLVK